MKKEEGKRARVGAHSTQQTQDGFFIAEVEDDSLINCQPPIKPDDQVIVRRTTKLQEGDLVAVLTRDGLLIKFLYYETDGRIRLESSNPDYLPQSFGDGEYEIWGVAWGILTNFQPMQPEAHSAQQARIAELRKRLDNLNDLADEGSRFRTMQEIRDLENALDADTDADEWSDIIGAEESEAA